MQSNHLITSVMLLLIFGLSSCSRSNFSAGSTNSENQAQSAEAEQSSIDQNSSSSSSDEVRVYIPDEYNREDIEIQSGSVIANDTTAAYLFPPGTIVNSIFEPLLINSEATLDAEVVKNYILEIPLSKLNQIDRDRVKNEDLSVIFKSLMGDLSLVRDIRVDASHIRLNLRDLGTYELVTTEQTTDLVGYWPLNEVKTSTTLNYLENMMDIESQSFVYTDFDNRQINFVNSRFERAMKFDGVQDTVVEIPQSKSLKITGAMTISLWVNSLDNQISYIYGKGYENSQTGVSLNLSLGGDLSFGVGIPQSGCTEHRIIEAKDILTQGSWHHVVSVFRPNESVELYVDGMLVGQSDASDLDSMCDPDLPLLLGNKGEPSVTADSSSFDGLLDELLIYQKALSESEISRLYK